MWHYSVCVLRLILKIKKGNHPLLRGLRGEASKEQQCQQRTKHWIYNGAKLCVKTKTKKTFQKVTKLDFCDYMLCLTTILPVKLQRNLLFPRREGGVDNNYKNIESFRTSQYWLPESTTSNPSNKHQAGLPACRSIADAPLRLAKSLQRRSGWCSALWDGSFSPSLTRSALSLVAAAPSTLQQRPPHHKGSSLVRRKRGKKGNEKAHHLAKSSRHDNHASYRFIYSFQLLMPNMVTLLFPPLLSASQAPFPSLHTHTPPPPSFITSSFPSFSQPGFHPLCLMYTDMNVCSWHVSENLNRLWLSN